MNVTEWLEEISEAKKREKDFRNDGDEILEIYANKKKTPFNILYSNTETLLPALFSDVPRPVVTRRFKDEDPLGKAVSQAAQRVLEYLIDTDTDGYDNFQGSITSATMDGLLPGRGITAVKYENENGWETVCTDSKCWNRVYFGYAKKWSKVPWICYEEYLDREEARELFGSKANKLKFVEKEENDENEDNDDKKGTRKTTLIYQVWDRTDKKILYISPNNKQEFMKTLDDPLELTGFFNCPRPIEFVEKSNDLEPTALYSQYKNQATELNSIQRRLNNVIKAIKARGCYNGALGEEIEKILKEDDNALVPTDKASMLAEGGLDKNIWFLPLAELVAVAQQLIMARESAKQVIYEITGISDIIRGQSKASETLGAQEIKAEWGTMRLKRLQKEVQRYALDTMRLMLDIAVKKFSEKTWAKMTGLPFSTTEQKEQAQKILEAAKMQAQQAIMMGQQPPQSPMVQEAQQILQRPYWGDVLDVLKDNYQRSYRIDIETNSTLDVEATEDKQLVGDFMNAMAQFMNGVAPMIKEGVMPFPAAKSMMLAIVKRYRFGREVEEEINAMQAPKPQSDPEQEKAIKEFKQAKEKFDKERQQAEEALQKEANNIKAEKAQFDFDKQLAKLEQKHREDLMKLKQDTTQTEMEASLKAMLEKHKSDVRSMLDKQMARVQAVKSKNAA